VSDFHAFEQRGWEGAAAAYHEGFQSLTGAVAGPLLDAARVGPGTRLLDLACGPGYICRLAVDRGAAVTGLDFSAAMIGIARAMAPDATFRQGDVQAIPFGDDGFDAVTASFVLGHLTDPERAAREMHRVLRPGGRVAVSWWSSAERAVAFGIVWRAIQAHGRTDVGLPPGPPFDAHSDPASLATLFAGAGFGGVHVEAQEFRWRIPDGEAIFRAYFDGTVRTAGLLRAQTPDALEAIRQEIVTASAAYRGDDGLDLPMEVLVVSGTHS